MNSFFSNLGTSGTTVVHADGTLILLVAVWGLFWKGLALWHAGRRGQPWWFVILFLVNTVGILELIYLFFVLKLKPSKLFKK